MYLTDQISLFDCLYFLPGTSLLVQNLNLGGVMTLSSSWCITNVKKKIKMKTDRSFAFCFMFSLDKYALLQKVSFVFRCNILLARISEEEINIQLKFSISAVFDNTDKLKKTQIWTSSFSKSGYRCRFGLY